MIKALKKYLWTFARWVWTRIFGTIGALLLVGLLAVMFTPLNHDGTWGNNAMENITATTTAEFTLEGIDNPEEMKQRIEVMIQKEQAQQQKNKAQQQLEELQRKQTSLE